MEGDDSTARSRWVGWLLRWKKMHERKGKMKGRREGGEKAAVVTGVNTTADGMDDASQPKNRNRNAHV